VNNSLFGKYNLCNIRVVIATISNDFWLFTAQQETGDAADDVDHIHHYEEFGGGEGGHGYPPGHHAAQERTQGYCSDTTQR